MNKILEVLEKKQKVVVRTGSPWDWVQGYPESQWELLCRLENGSFVENEEEITFYTNQNEEIGLTKDFLIENTKSKAVYGSMGTVQIHKNLIEKDIFEITDRVGHYIRIRVEPMFNDNVSTESDYKYARLNGQQLALLFIALSKSLFQRPRKGQVYFESHNDGSCTLYFKRDYYSALTDSIFKASYQGKFAQSNSENEWNDLKEKIDNAKVSEKDNVEELSMYSIYDE